ncbi:MAG: GntR family transcriptional regulator [Peptoniphilaceae bacterium]|nr:GntR family transcriptional regulator [Peptoniphilaceae bacterium]MDD7383891.1 GntR family transcriptional regulator [Peptoniphilaceae bacterium]MDY3738032.1 GntR family transcriptional regulator [Peptoniphilaceae bacterium]
MEFEANKPIYSQIADLIVNKIIREELKSGDKLPSIREMAKEFNVNPNTVQRAYQELDMLKITENKRGKGIFVSIDENEIKKMKISVAKEMLNKFISEMKKIDIDKDFIVKFIEENWR